MSNDSIWCSRPRIGEGLASRVYQVTDTLVGTSLALKAYDLAAISDSMMRSVLTEISIHAALGERPRGRFHAAACFLGQCRLWRRASRVGRGGGGKSASTNMRR